MVGEDLKGELRLGGEQGEGRDAWHLLLTDGDVTEEVTWPG